MPNEELEKVFTDIFCGGKWGRGRSKSGTGSTLEATQPLRAGLATLFSDFQLTTFIDAPCGTAEWITEVTRPLNLYLGFDLVRDLIDTARSTPGLPVNHLFNVADITTDVLPKADAILCRDCLVHLPFALALQALSNFKASGSTYLLATTFPKHDNDELSGLGSWRPINLELAPFNFPPPLRLIRDRVEREGDRWADKSIGVWRLDSIVVQ